MLHLQHFTNSEVLTIRPRSMGSGLADPALLTSVWENGRLGGVQVLAVLTVNRQRHINAA